MKATESMKCHPSTSTSLRNSSSSRGTSISRHIFRGRYAALAMAGVLAMLSSRAFADPVLVSYTTTHVSGSEWQYTYQLTGSYMAGDDLAIYFPVASSSDLASLVPAGGDWTGFVLQPDAGLPSDGEFDLIANVDDPSLATVFSVDFQFPGSVAPGAQSFTLFDPSFAPIASGTTTSAATPSVPEPGSLALLGTGALGVFGLRRRLLR